MRAEVPITVRRTIYFFVSGALRKKGLVNGLPDLNDLKDGDLQYKIDFKQVYATVLAKWLGVDSEAILGAKYEPLGLI